LKEIIPTYIGVSPSLSINAPGHYLPFHGKLFEEFRNQNPQSIYLGAEGSEKSDTWWMRWAPHTLRSRPNFLSLGKFVQLCGVARREKNSYFVVYEGSLFHLILFSCVTAMSNSSALVNLHYSSELSSRMGSTFGKIYVKSIFKLCNKISLGAVVLASESVELSSEIESKTGVFPTPFPVFSVLDDIQPSEVIELLHTWVICRIVHKWQLENLITALKDNPSEIFLVNGLKEEQKKQFRDLPNVRIQDQYLTPEEYRYLLAGSKQIVLAYDTEMYKGHSSGRLLDAMIFGKLIVAIEGMPVPVFARQYRNLKMVKFAELTSNFGNWCPQSENLLKLKPNAVWAVEQIRDMYPKFHGVSESTRRKPYFLPILFFAAFYLSTFVSRGSAAVITRFLHLASKTNSKA
jgi:hypothetical protein